MKKAKVKLIIMIVIVLLIGAGLLLWAFIIKHPSDWLIIIKNNLTNKYAYLIYALIGLTAVTLSFQYIKGKKKL